MNQLLDLYPNEVRQILAKYPENFRRAAVMPLLHLAQRQEMFVGSQALEDIAQICEITTTDVASIVGFYTLYYDQPQGKYRIQVCTDMPCALRGAEKFMAELLDRLGIAEGETTPDGLFTVEAVKCLAACHRAPMFQVHAKGVIEYHENQNVELALAWMEEVRRQQGQGEVQE